MDQVLLRTSIFSLFCQENDYLENYFEDGDDYGAGSDDNMDEATY